MNANLNSKYNYLESELLVKLIYLIKQFKWVTVANFPLELSLKL